MKIQRRQWHPTPVLLPGKSHGRRSLEGCSPCGLWGSDTTERLHFHFSLSCIGEGNGNLLQFSCMENPRDRGAWWAAVYGVAQSRTWVMRLSSRSRSSRIRICTYTSYKISSNNIEFLYFLFLFSQCFHFLCIEIKSSKFSIVLNLVWHLMKICQGKFSLCLLQFNFLARKV